MRRGSAQADSHAKIRISWMIHLVAWMLRVASRRYESLPLDAASRRVGSWSGVWLLRWVWASLETPDVAASER